MKNLITWHQHHIVPRHAGGSDNPSNLVRVNLAMHIFLHEQRYKELGQIQDKWAAQMMRGTIGKEELHRQFASEGGKKGGKVQGPRNKGLKRSDETKKAIGDATRGRSCPHFHTQIQTPDGIFNSIKEAAEHYGINYQTAKTRVHKQYKGWRRVV